MGVDARLGAEFSCRNILTFPAPKLELPPTGPCERSTTKANTLRRNRGHAFIVLEPSFYIFPPEWLARLLLSLDLQVGKAKHLSS